MSQHNSCETILLGQSGVCSVTQCPECNLFHLHVGPMSLRLNAKVFESVCQTLTAIYLERGGHKKNFSNSLHSH